MNDLFKFLKMSKKDPIKQIILLLPDSSSFTGKEIEDAVDEVLKMKYFVNENREMLIRRIEELYTIRQDELKHPSKVGGRD